MKIDLEAPRSKVVELKLKPKADKHLVVVEKTSACTHPRVIVDPDLLELRCGECKEKLNPITYLVRVADQFIRWDYQLTEIKRHRAELEKRKQCRCLKCGEITPIGAVGRHQVERIRKARAAREPEA